MRKSLLKVALLGLLAVLPAYAQPGSGSAYRYPLDFAAQLLPRSELGSCLPEDGSASDGQPQAVLKSRAMPLEGLDVAPNRGVHQVKAPTTWEIPPFSEIDPALPADASPATRKLYEHRLAEGGGARPAAFSSVPTSMPKPSIMLRPRTVYTHHAVRSQNLEIPAPFSAVRFNVSEGFVQLSLYGGTNSFDAEEAYLALRNSVGTKEMLDGLGREAFYSTYKEPLPPAPEVVTPKPGERPFQGLEVNGKATPEWVDPNLQAAKKAPAFQDVATPRTRLEGSLTSLLPPKPNQVRKVYQPEYLVLVAYFPDKAVTLELAIDSRVADVQKLIGMGLTISAKIINLR